MQERLPLSFMISVKASVSLSPFTGIPRMQAALLPCLEEIAYLNGWITKDEVLKTYELVKKNQYGQYLKDVLDGKYREQLY